MPEELKSSERSNSMTIASSATKRVSPSCNRAELAYWSGVPYWGKGLIPEASKVVIEHAFTSLNMAGHWCGFYENNTQSFRAQEKCGFKIVRTFDPKH